MKLNLGCGKKKLHGWINIDMNKDVKPDIVCDVMHLPFKDNSIDKMYSRALVEHIPNLVGFMEEVWKISKNGTVITFIYPHANCLALACNDITHVRLMTEHSFDFFTIDEPYNFYTRARFKKKKVKLLRTAYGNMFPERITKFISNFVGFMIKEVYIELETIK